MPKGLLCLLFSCIIFFNQLISNDLVVGTTSAYAPYVSLNEQGEYVGFDIDVANAIGKKLQRKVVIKDLGSMPSLLLALKKKKVHVVIWAVSITQKRQEQMEMVYYQGELVKSLPLLFWKEIPSGVARVEDVAGSIAVEGGSFQEEALNDISGLNVKPVDKMMDALMEIKYGKSAATLIDPPLLPKIQQQFPDIKVLDMPLPPSKQSFGNGICINKSNEALIQEIKQVVKELQQEGVIAELEKKWNLAG